MKICYPKDSEGNLIGIRTPEKFVYDTNGISLTTKLRNKVNVYDIGSAAAKNSTNEVTENSTDLVESGAVYTAINNAIGSTIEELYSTDF